MHLNTNEFNSMIFLLSLMIFKSINIEYIFYKYLKLFNLLANYFKNYFLVKKKQYYFNVLVLFNIYKLLFVFNCSILSYFE